ncbi:Cilia- And Flagella-Associated Protein 70 [Manis pentadactyla]|nr:Cilia- And Flagella-Associated Protein 70 [Manis pentadactyla]
MDMALINFQCPHLSWKKTTGFLGHGQILLRVRTIPVGRVQGQDGGEPPGSASTVDQPESAVTNRKEKEKRIGDVGTWSISEDSATGQPTPGLSASHDSLLSCYLCW